MDSSVWIANLRGQETEPVRKLHQLDFEQGQILIGDLILMEVLMGARDEAQAIRIRSHMHQFPVAPLMNPEIAEEAARNFRALRRLGITIRTGIDVVIGTYCIRHGHTLLHDDRDFAPMQKHLGLSVL
ncbi:MAG TPA: PIN domain nuclease [Acetobacteraceae bacterium]|nr:PIN domain nuclease [Acetobacteraceae bacterium]